MPAAGRLCVHRASRSGAAEVRLSPRWRSPPESSQGSRLVSGVMVSVFLVVVDPGVPCLAEADPAGGGPWPWCSSSGVREPIPVCGRTVSYSVLPRRVLRRGRRGRRCLRGGASLPRGGLTTLTSFSPDLLTETPHPPSGDAAGRGALSRSVISNGGAGEASTPVEECGSRLSSRDESAWRTSHRATWPFTPPRRSPGPVRGRR